MDAFFKDELATEQNLAFPVLMLISNGTALRNLINSEMEYCTKTTRCRHTTLFGKNRPQTHMNKWKIAVTRHKIFIGRTDAEAAAPILWPPHTKS